MNKKPLITAGENEIMLNLQHERNSIHSGWQWLDWEWDAADGNISSPHYSFCIFPILHSPSQPFSIKEALDSASIQSQSETLSQPLPLSRPADNKKNVKPLKTETGF